MFDRVWCSIYHLWIVNTFMLLLKKNIALRVLLWKAKASGHGRTGIFCDGHTDLKIDDHVSPMKYLRIYQKNEEKQQK